MPHAYFFHLKDIQFLQSISRRDMHFNLVSLELSWGFLGRIFNWKYSAEYSARGVPWWNMHLNLFGGELDWGFLSEICILIYSAESLAVGFLSKICILIYSAESLAVGFLSEICILIYSAVSLAGGSLVKYAS